MNISNLCFYHDERLVTIVLDMMNEHTDSSQYIHFLMGICTYDKSGILGIKHLRNGNHLKCLDVSWTQPPSFHLNAFDLMHWSCVAER